MAPRDSVADTPETVTRSAGRFFSGTLLSRLTGLGRDVAMAAAFGSAPALAAFMVGYRFAQVLRRLLGESALQSAFVPHYEKVKALGPAILRRFVLASLCCLLLLVGLLVLLTETGLLSWLAWGSPAESTREVAKLTAIMLPGLLFICFYSLNSAILQCEGSYFTPAFAPVLFNIVWISGVLLFFGTPAQEAAPWLAWMILLALAAQWLTTLPKLLQALPNSSEKSSTALRPLLKAAAGSLLLSMVGIGAAQINSALDALFARLSSAEGPAYLWYAVRIQQAPLALFGVALSGALLPPLARAAKQNDTAQFEHLLSFSLRSASALIWPLTVGLLVMALPGVCLLYFYGAFSSQDAIETTYCLWAYGLGIPATIWTILLAPAFYAHEKFGYPALVAVLAMLCNVGLNALFIFGFAWGPLSIALATSCATYFNWALLQARLSAKMPLRTLFVPKTFCSALCAGLSALWVGKALGDPSWELLFGTAPVTVAIDFSQRLLILAAQGITFLAVLLLTAKLLRAKELFNLVDRFWRRSRAQ